MERDAIGSDAIREALGALLQQPQLRKSPQLSTFLSYVVSESLAGRGHLLKSYTIATDPLGRPAHFDPATDAIVRVEARRLRQVLQQIYEDPGCPLGVRIDLPLGRYDPTFERIAPSPERPERDPGARRLREAEERYRALVTASAAVAWRAAAEGPPVRGIGWIAPTGDPEDVLQEEDWLVRVHPDDRGPAEAAWRSARRTGRTFEVVYRLRQPDGRYRWTLSRGVPLRNRDGTLREWVGLLSDIDARVAAESVLDAPDADLRLAVAAAGLSTWEVDGAARTVRWSETAPIRIGSGTEAVEAWLARIEAADAPRLREALAAALRGDGRVDLVYRARGAAGDEGPIACRGGPVRAAGGAIRLLGVAASVTACPVPP